MYKTLFFQWIVKPVIFLIAGISVGGKEYIPPTGPYIIVANHNSHLDALAIMCLYKKQQINNVSPVAAADYFLQNKLLKWVALNLIGITPINRQLKKSADTGMHPLDTVYNCIEAGKILIIFPEGSRGQPGQLQKFKSGIAHIAEKYPDLKIVPVVLENTGKSLPKNEALFVPLIIKAEVKKPFSFNELGLDSKAFVGKIEDNFKEVKQEASHE